jgi:hypothetical protein
MASGGLGNLAAGNDAQKAAIVGAGVIPLLGGGLMMGCDGGADGGPVEGKAAAVRVLRNLLAGNSANRAAVAVVVVEAMGGGSHGVSNVESRANFAVHLMESLCK